MKKDLNITKPRYSEQILPVPWPFDFSGSIPPKFKHKIRLHKQRFEKIATTVALVKDENLL